jgi:hypothetical protein
MGAVVEVGKWEGEERAIWVDPLHRRHQVRLHQSQLT